MKPITLLALLCSLALLPSCQSSQSVNPVSTTTATTSTTAFDLAGQTLLGQGTFASNAHITSGTVKLYEKAGKRTLTFTDFKTDSGPDLRIYLAENTATLNFIEVTKLDKTGTFSVELPTGADPVKQKYVLIWCKAFSVLFGNSELK